MRKQMDRATKRWRNSGANRERERERRMLGSSSWEGVGTRSQRWRECVGR